MVAARPASAKITLAHACTADADDNSLPKKGTRSTCELSTKQHINKQGHAHRQLTSYPAHGLQMLALTGPGCVFTVKVQSQAQNVVLVVLKSRGAESAPSYSGRDVRQVLSPPRLAAFLEACLGIGDVSLLCCSLLPSVSQPMSSSAGIRA